VLSRQSSDLAHQPNPPRRFPDLTNLKLSTYARMAIGFLFAFLSVSFQSPELQGAHQ
jgi:hypothetical protein